MSDAEVREFKAELARRGITMKDFCAEVGVNYGTFNGQVNRIRPLSDTNIAIMREFMKSGGE